MLNNYIEVEGFDVLLTNLKKIKDDKAKKREILIILRRLSKPVVNVAKSKVPVQRSSSNLKTKRTIVGGSLRQSLGIITGKKGNAKENPTVYVGPRVFKGKKAKLSGRNTYGDGWYGHMVDQGHDIYGNYGNKGKVSKKGRKGSTLGRLRGKSKGNVIGHVKGAFFMKKTFQATSAGVAKESESAVAKYFQSRIDKLSK